MPLNSNALVSLATVKTEMSITATTYDTKLERLINVASQLIEKYVDRKLVQQEFTTYQDGRGSNKIVLKNYPAQKPSAMYIDNSGVFDSTSLVAATDYVLDGDDTVALRGWNFPRGTQNIKLVYTAGFSTIPSDIENACIQLVEYLYDMGSDRRLGVTSKSKRDENISYELGIPKFIQVQLDPYVRYEFPSSNSPVLNT